jgi:hypothetical protein
MARSNGVAARILIAALGAAFSVVAVAFLGCGDGETPPVLPTPPAIVQTDPVDGASAVNLNPVIKVWFDRAIDPASLDTLALSVNGAAPCEVFYDDAAHRADFYLSALLDPAAQCSVTVSGDIESAEGAAMEDDFEFDFTTGPLDCAHLTDWAEPNDSPGTAVQLEVGKRYRLLSSCGGGRYDYYKFTITEPATIKAHCYHVYSDTSHISWYQNFLREDGEYYVTHGVWFAAPSTPATGYSFLPGTYWVQIGNTENDAHIGVYDIVLEASEACEDDAYEDNDFIDDATPLTPGLHEDLRGCYVDYDFYSVAVDSGKTLTVTVTDQSGIGGCRFYLHGPDLSQVAGTSSAPSPTTLSWTATVSGNHYVKLMWWSNGVNYDLDIEVTD